MADNVMVALVLGTDALGNYAMAYNLAGVPIAILVYTFASVMFPAYATGNRVRWRVDIVER